MLSLVLMAQMDIPQRGFRFFSRQLSLMRRMKRLTQAEVVLASRKVDPKAEGVSLPSVKRWEVGEAGMSVMDFSSFKIMAAVYEMNEDLFAEKLQAKPIEEPGRIAAKNKKRKPK
jgi:hypothetical protein